MHDNENTIYSEFERWVWTGAMYYAPLILYSYGWLTTCHQYIGCNFTSTANHSSAENSYNNSSAIQMLNCSTIRLILNQSIGLSSVLRPRQHSIGYMGDGDGFYR